ncbi:MAG: RND family transporter [Bacteroidia bacterium]
MFTPKERILSYLVLGLTLLFAAWSGWQASQVEFDYDFERFFPANAPETAFYDDFRARYGSESDFFLLSILRDKGVFDAAFLAEINALTDTLSQIEGVEQVLSPTNLKSLRIDPLLGLPLEVPYLNLAGDLGQDSSFIFEQPDLVGAFFSQDGRALSLWVNHAPNLSDSTAGILSNTIESRLADFDFEESHIAGRIAGQTYYIGLMQREVVVFLSISLVLIITFLWFAFRSFWGIVVPLSIVGLAVLGIVGFLSFLVKPLNVFSNVIPSVLLVVCLSAVVHILSKYLDELRLGRNKRDALLRALWLVGRANVLTTITTAIGFLTLLNSSVKPMGEFGLFMSIGVAFGLALAYTVLPAVLIILPPPPIRKSDQAGGFWYQYLHRSLRWILAHPKQILVGSGVLLLVCGIGISQLQVNNYLIEDLKEDNPVKQSFNFFETQFSGARPLELELKLVDSSRSFAEPLLLRQVSEIEHYLQNDYEVGFVRSPLSFVKAYHRAQKSGEGTAYRLPESDKDLRKIWRKIGKMRSRLGLENFLNSDQNRLRISAQMADIGSIKIRQKDQKLAIFMQNYPDFSYQLTGAAVLVDKNNEVVASNILYGLMIAFGAIAILAGLLFRSLRMVLITLIPNVFPLAIIAAFMGYVGIDLKLSTSIVFTIAFGIAVDDTIHFLSRFYLESKRQPWLFALRRAFISTGKAIVITTLILSGGFLALTFSDFLGTLFIGLLISMTLFSALLADLIILPVLLLLFYPKHQKESNTHERGERTESNLDKGTS